MLVSTRAAMLHVQQSMVVLRWHVQWSICQLCLPQLTVAQPMQVYLYICSSKHVLGCVVAERITCASPVISHSEACVTSGCSTDVAAPRPCLDSPSMPMSTPPLAKHRRLSSQLPARSAASMMPLTTRSESSACTEGTARQDQRTHADAKLGMHRLEMGIASCPSQQHVSVGSNQSAAVPSGIKHRRHQQSKHPKKTLLTRWLATGKTDTTGVQTAPARMRSDSPTSAGSTAAFKHGDSQATAETRLEQCGINSPIPMMPLTDVTNMCDVRTSGASAAMATDHDDLGSSDLAACTSSQQVLKVNSSAFSSAPHDGSMWQQDPDLVECRPYWSEGGTPQVCHDVAARTTDHPAADGSVNAEVAAAFEALETASQSLSRLRPEGQTEILMTDRSKAVKAVCGIKVMWVSAQARRQGIATQLLDTARFVLELQASHPSRHKSVQWTLMIPIQMARCNLESPDLSMHFSHLPSWHNQAIVALKQMNMPSGCTFLSLCRCNCVAGYVVPRSQLAFSQPTQAGRRLAEQYTQTHSFLVYQ